MKFLLGDNLTERDKDRIECPEDLLSQMEKSGILSVDKRGLLSDLLLTINRPALAQELDNFNGRSSGKVLCFNTHKAIKNQNPRL